MVDICLVISEVISTNYNMWSRLETASETDDVIFCHNEELSLALLAILSK